MNPISGKRTFSRLETESSRPSIVVRVEVAIGGRRTVAARPDPCRAGAIPRPLLGRLVGRRPRQVGWRNRPAVVHSPNPTSPTSSGRTKCAAPGFSGREDGDEGALGVAEPSKILRERPGVVGAESGSHLADVAQPAVVGDPEQQRAQARRRSPRPSVHAPTTTSWVRKDLTLVQSGLRRPGRYGEARRLAMTPSSPLLARSRPGCPGRRRHGMRPWW